MGYKIQGTINKSKKHFIIYAILWLFSVIVFIMPAGAAISEANVTGTFDFNKFIVAFTSYMMEPFSSFSKVFLPGYISSFIGILWKFTLVYLIIAVVGTARTAPKGEYEDIEHGSSDWSKNGEQYKILSKKNGIILGQDNYLPVDKRGNVNVLVVGRFRFW